MWPLGPPRAGLCCWSSTMGTMRSPSTSNMTIDGPRPTWGPEAWPPMYGNLKNYGYEKMDGPLCPGHGTPGPCAGFFAHRWTADPRWRGQQCASQGPWSGRLDGTGGIYASDLGLFRAPTQDQGKDRTAHRDGKHGGLLCGLSGQWGHQKGH